MSYIWSDPAWPRLFLEFTIHASQDDVFRAKLAERYADLHDRVTELYRRWSARFPARPPIPMSAIATMTFCMANGFNVERIIRPGVDEEVYPAMLEVFFRGLVAMAVEHTEAQAGNAAPISSAASSP